MPKKRTRYLLYPAKDQSNKEVLEFPSEEARSNYARNMNRSLVIPSDFPENDSQQQYTFSAGVLPEVLVTPKTQNNPSQSNPIPTQQLITDLNSPTYQDYIDTRYQSRGPVKTKDNFTLSDWSRNIPKSYWSSDTHRNFKDGMTAASLFTAAPFAAEAAGEYVLPWLSEVSPYLTARGWLKSTQAVGNTPAWLTPKVATAIDATLAGSGTATSIDDIRKNGPNFWNVLGTGLGVVGLSAEAAPTVVDLYQSGKRAYNTYQLGRLMNKTVSTSEIPPQLRPFITNFKFGKGSGLVVRSDGGNGVGAFTDTGAYIKDGFLYPGKSRIEGQRDFTWFNEDELFTTKKLPRVFIANKSDIPGLQRVREMNEPVGQWIPGSRAFVRKSEMVTPEPIDITNLTQYNYNPDLGIYVRSDIPNKTIRIEESPEISNVPTIDIRQSLVNQYNTNKYIRLLGKAKDSDQFKGSIKDRSIVTRPFAEYLEKLGINSSLFTEKDLNTLMQMRSKLVQRTIPQTGRSAISYETKPKNQQTVISIDINENGTTLGEISARSHNPNHPRANEVPIDMVSRVEVSPSRGLSEDAYNAAIDYVKQTGIGEGLVSGERLLSPEITYNVWKHYPNRQLLRTNGHHTFGTGRDVVGQPVSETHKGPVVMLTEPSKTPLPMKSNSIFHPDMIKDGKLLPPDWTKYGIYYSLPLLLGTYGMFTNKKAN